MLTALAFGIGWLAASIAAGFVIGSLIRVGQGPREEDHAPARSPGSSLRRRY